ncbi:MAG: septum formation protein [Anaerolineaceae bacterium]|nr:MAG: septum formation protein [Anaerolineaceae bacterium]
MTATAPLVLASNSPRRRELLALGGWTFTVRPADVDESPLPGEAPGTCVLRLAESKAEACPGGTVIAADTTVAIDGVMLGKPRDAAEAVEMLRRLRGRRHTVHTGLGVKQGGLLLTDLCATGVPMRPYSDEEIDAYVASGDPLDKAGAYAIQHAGFHPVPCSNRDYHVEKFSGCYASVMGLPLCHLVRTLRKMGIVPLADVPAACQARLQYDCPIHSAVLNGETIG